MPSFYISNLKGAHLKPASDDLHWNQLQVRVEIKGKTGFG